MENFAETSAVYRKVAISFFILLKQQSQFKLQFYKIIGIKTIKVQWQNASRTLAINSASSQ